MRLHDDIMNIQRAVQKQLSAAAEMAIKADAEIERLKAENAKLRVRLDECNRRVNEMTPRKLTKLQVADFVVDAPSLDAAIRASYNAGHDAGWSAGRESRRHEENDK